MEEPTAPVLSAGKPDLLAFPVARYSSETRIFRDANCPGAEFSVTLRPPSPLERSKVMELSAKYMQEFVTGVRKENGKIKEKPIDVPVVGGGSLEFTEDVAAEVAIMQSLQAEDAPVHWGFEETVLMITRAPDVFLDWREWALSIWRRDNRGNLDPATTTTR